MKMRCRDLAKLSEEFRPLAEEFLKEANELEPITVIETWRSHENHLLDLKSGVSWTSHSPHEDGDAIDACPTRLLVEKQWGPGDPVWQKLGTLAQELGIEWGGTWLHKKDLDHFQLRR
jgi:hypothetical protein